MITEEGGTGGDQHSTHTSGFEESALDLKDLSDHRRRRGQVAISTAHTPGFEESALDLKDLSDHRRRRDRW